MTTAAELFTRTMRYPDGSQEIAIHKMGLLRRTLLRVVLGQPAAVVFISSEQAESAQSALGPYLKIDKE